MNPKSILESMDLDLLLNSLSKLAANLAHEIRNPLASISATTQVMKAKLPGEDPRQKYPLLILKEVDRINQIIGGLLDLENDEMIHFQSFKLSDLFDKIKTILEMRLEKRGIQFILEIPEDIEHIFSDRLYLEKIIISVCRNAIEAINRDQGFIKIGIKKNDPFCQILISNNGKKIEEKDQKLIFNPFFTTKIHGLGLGLTLSQRRVQKISGSLKLLQSSDEETIFNLNVPLSVE